MRRTPLASTTTVNWKTIATVAGHGITDAVRNSIPVVNQLRRERTTDEPIRRWDAGDIVLVQQRTLKPL
jgi:hypothetical protein